MDRDDHLYWLPPDWRIEARATPLSEVYDWSFAFLGIPPIWKQTAGEGVTVAVLDTGIDYEHPDLESQIVAAKDFTRSRHGAMDRHSHGTHCSGLVAAAANEVGVRGVAYKAKLLAAKVLGDGGGGSDREILAGFEWAASQGADIISMSLGGPAMSNHLRAAVQTFVGQPGHYVIAAAGNDGRSNSVNYPAVWPEIVAVSAVDKNGNLTKFSSYGPEVDIAAPGFKILSTIPQRAYGEMNGTSMAAPIVAGVCALYLAAAKQAGTQLPTYQQLMADLQASALDKGKPGKDDGYGFGLINPGGLVARIKTGDQPTDQPVGPVPELQAIFQLGALSIAPLKYRGVQGMFLYKQP